MSSGWPPEEDDHRWEPVRHASVVGAGHDSRGAERGYSGYARYTPDADNSGEFGPYDLPPSYDEDGWYTPAGAPGPQDTSHPSGPLPGTHGGYGGAGGADLYGAPVYADADYGEAGHVPAQPGAAPSAAGPYGPGQYDGAQYDGATYEGDGHDGEGYAAGPYADDAYGAYEPDGQHPGQTAGYQPGGYEGHDAGGYRQAGYGTDPQQTGYGTDSQQASYPGYPVHDDQPGAYRETAYPQAGYHDGQGYPSAAPHQQGAGQHGLGQQGPGARATSPQAAVPDYGYQDYGDPRYDDPSYGDLAYDDTPHPTPRRPASGYRGAAPAAPSYPDADYPDAGYPDAGYADEQHGSGGYPGVAALDGGYDSGAYPAVDSPGYAGDEYDAYPDAGSGFAGAAPGAGYASYDPGDQPGYVAAEYASGQYPPGVGAIGDLSAGMPDPVATGMLDATGILDSSGLSDSADLYNYHRGAAEASPGFLDAPAPVGTLDVTGLDPSGYLDDHALGDHGTILDGAEAGAATGVLEGGSGFFDDAELGETTSVDLPAASLSRGARTGGTGALLRPRPSSRPVGRRRGRSGDRRLWFALAGVVVVFVGALVAIVMVAFPSGPGGPAHTLVAPNQLNAFTRRPALEQQMNVAQLRQDVVNTSSGQARHVVEAVYEAGNSTSGTPPQIILFIGGNLLNAAPNVSVTSFTQRFKGAKITNAGGAGEAACVNATASEPGSVAMCAWFDNDSFGEVVSPTMNAAALASTMRQIRPHVELIAKQKQ